jgi:16S rRNA (guanine527-N7)-methyltransferase
MAEVDPLEGVSRETLQKLSLYVDLLGKWTQKINLVAPSTLPTVWERHIRDSAQLLDLVDVRAGHWVDLGSGGGLPGVVVAIIAAERAPALRFTCVESDQRKGIFLETVSRETGVPISLITDRVERVLPLNADVLSARALAPLDRLLDFAERHLAVGGVALFQKGAQHEKERIIAEKRWRFDGQVSKSFTDPAAVIYKIGTPSRV